jgi:putative N6-adenine-specific DNA methylase
MIRVEYGDVRELPMQPQGTWLLTNPPYGERLGGEDVTTLYREMGQGLRHKNLHRLAILSGHPDFAEQFGWPVTRTSHLRNGKLEVQLLTFAGDAV